MHGSRRHRFDVQLSALEAERHRLAELIETARLLLRQADDERQRMATLVERLNRERQRRIAQHSSAT